MDVMTVSLLILALCPLVQLGFFLWDRYQRRRYIVPAAAVAQSFDSYRDALMKASFAVGLLCLVLYVLFNRRF
jgi:hypothetical protein